MYQEKDRRAGCLLPSGQALTSLPETLDSRDQRQSSANQGLVALSPPSVKSRTLSSRLTFAEQFLGAADTA